MCKWPGNEAWTVDNLVSQAYVGPWSDSRKREKEKREEEVAYCIGGKPPEQT